MRKNDIVNRLVLHDGIARSVALKAVDCVFDSIRNALADGDTVTIRGFATISVKQCKDKYCLNLKGGAPIFIPSHNVIKFKPCYELKKIVTGQS